MNCRLCSNLEKCLIKQSHPTLNINIDEFKKYVRTDLEQEMQKEFKDDQEHLICTTFATQLDSVKKFYYAKLNCSYIEGVDNIIDNLLDWRLDLEEVIQEMKPDELADTISRMWEFERNKNLDLRDISEKIEKIECSENIENQRESLEAIKNKKNI